jgi:hypothetical protein
MTTIFLAPFWIYIIVGAFLGFVAVKSDMFREGAGLVLAFIMVIAVVVAAIAGTLSSFLPAPIGAVVGRLALLCLSFAVSAFFCDR